MIRLIVVLPLVWLLAACQAGTDLYGKGPLVLSESAEATLTKNIHGENGIRENLIIAIDTRLRRIGGVYCPSTDIHACLDTGGLTALMAVDNCNKDGKYDCKVYSVIDKIVWQGPIFVRHRATGQRLPYHGVWPVSLTWEGATAGAAVLTLDQGKALLTGTSAGTCEVNFRPTNADSGDVGIRCSDGRSAGGEYSRSSSQTVSGKGQDSDGKAISFDLKLDRGTSATGSPKT